MAFAPFTQFPMSQFILVTFVLSLLNHSPLATRDSEGFQSETATLTGKPSLTILPVSQSNPTKGASPTSVREITSKDGVPMILISAGDFWMGSTTEEIDKVTEECLKILGEFRITCRSFLKYEQPRHKVFLPAFYMDKFEVTTSRYAQFLQASRREPPRDWDHVDLEQHGQHPVVGIDWHDAEAYCRWAGKRLPTEAEWEKAVRVPDGRHYPWGNEIPTTDMANFDNVDQDLGNDLYSKRLKPVGSYPKGASAYGIFDLGGNVGEWVADWYEARYYERSPYRNPKGSADGTEKVTRGGSWFYPSPVMRSAFRSGTHPLTRIATLGVRCAKDAP